MLAVVEHEQDLCLPHAGNERLDDLRVTVLADVERCGDPSGDQFRCGGSREIDEVNAVWKVGQRPPGRFERHPGLADAADAGEG